jgi:hypothetical protein
MSSRLRTQQWDKTSPRPKAALVSPKLKDKPQRDQTVLMSLTTCKRKEYLQKHKNIFRLSK